MKLPKLPFGFDRKPWGYSGLLFTEGQMRAYGEDCRSTAIDDAAEIINSQLASCNDMLLRDILISHINAIKGLK